MKINRPKKSTWWIAFIVGLVGIISQFVAIPFVSGFAFWIVAAAWLLLILANTMKGL